MKKHDLLPDELLWAEGGHASDVVLTAMADAQDDIVPHSVRAHIESCASCTNHLGNAVLLSLHTSQRMSVMAKVMPARRPLPRAAIGLGLGVAALGLVPTFLGGGTLSTLGQFVTHDLPIVARGLGTVASHAREGNTGLALTCGASLLLAMMAVAVIRLLPKKETSQ